MAWRHRNGGGEITAAQVLDAPVQFAQGRAQHCGQVAPHAPQQGQQQRAKQHKGHAHPDRLGLRALHTLQRARVRQAVELADRTHDRSLRPVVDIVVQHANGLGALDWRGGVARGYQRHGGALGVGQVVGGGLGLRQQG